MAVIGIFCFKQAPREIDGRKEHRNYTIIIFIDRQYEVYLNNVLLIQKSIIKVIIRAHQMPNKKR